MFVKKEEKPKVVQEIKKEESKINQEEPKGSCNGILSDIEEMIDRKLDAFLDRLETSKKVEEKISEDFDVGDVYEKKCEVKDISEWF